MRIPFDLTNIDSVLYQAAQMCVDGTTLNFNRLIDYMLLQQDEDSMFKLFKFAFFLRIYNVELTINYENQKAANKVCFFLNKNIYKIINDEDMSQSLNKFIVLFGDILDVSSIDIIVKYAIENDIHLYSLKQLKRSKFYNQYRFLEQLR